MNQKTLEKLEYPKIIEQLADIASSDNGKKMCLSLMPLTDLDAINQAQEETYCAFNRIVKKGMLSFYGTKPVEPSLKHLEIGGVLGCGELLHIRTLLGVCARAKAYGRPANENDAPDILSGYFAQLSPLTPLGVEIDRCIIAEDEFSDEASPQLKQIRREMNRLNERIHTTLNQLVNKSYRTYLQDPIVTMRGDRYCLPVKAEYKGKVPGMIHDQSSTGSTFFIEPIAVVNLNNDLQRVYAAEKDEIQKILAALSQEVALYVDEIRINEQMAASLDFIFSKGSLALKQNATRPIFNQDKIISIRQGRHPLLDAKTVVPITLTLGESFDLLIITGPNTGGKTVTLKTIGLFTLMGQAGLHIPALDRSRLALFHDVYADIGDEQSIEQSLSTFSSHMTNIVSFLKKVNQDSLVLFDELGAGTDPVEGAALAISILDYLHKKGIKTVATTHYSELKIYALTQHGVENASCEFDVSTLRPTYRLLIGVPGKSNAFAIAGKLGMPEEIIEEAKGHLSEQDESFEDVLTDLERSRRALEEEKEHIEAYKRELEAQKKDIDKKEERLNSRQEKIISEANEKARNILQDAKDTADDTVRNMRRFGENVSMSDMERERERLRNKMKSIDTAAPRTKTPKTKHKSSDFKLGDTVKVHSLNLTGYVISLPDKKNQLMVQMGIIKSKLPITDLEIIKEEPEYMKTTSTQGRKGTMNMGKAFSVSPEINLLGKNVDEACAILDKYLDDAYLSHLGSVRVVHGKGTGALRKGIHQFLKRQKHVKSFRLGAIGEGDSGVTIVELK